MSTLAERQKANREGLFSVHQCNAWCKGNVHAIVLHADRLYTFPRAKRDMRRHYGCTVREMTDAPEASPTMRRWSLSRGVVTYPQPYRYLAIVDFGEHP